MLVGKTGRKKTKGMHKTDANFRRYAKCYNLLQKHTNMLMMLKTRKLKTKNKQNNCCKREALERERKNASNRSQAAKHITVSILH